MYNPPQVAFLHPSLPVKEMPKSIQQKPLQPQLWKSKWQLYHSSHAVTLPDVVKHAKKDAFERQAQRVQILLTWFQAGAGLLKPYSTPYE